MSEPKIYCLNKDKFMRCLGYGGWGTITFVLISLLVVNLIELEGGSFVDRSFGGEFIYRTDFCYETILTHEGYCFPAKYYVFTIAFSLMNAANFIVIGIWIYDKQQRFKFGWCEK